MKKLVWIFLILTLALLHSKCWCSIDAVCTYAHKNVYLVGLGRANIPFLDCTVENRGLDSIIDGFQRRNTTLKVLVLFGMARGYPGDEIAMGYDELAVKMTDGARMDYLRLSTNDDSPMFPYGLVIRYNLPRADWNEIKNLVEYGVSHIEDIKKHQGYVCRRHRDSWVDPASGDQRDEVVTDTAGITIDRSMLERIMQGQTNINVGYEPTGMQTIYNMEAAWKETFEVLSAFREVTSLNGFRSMLLYFDHEVFNRHRTLQYVLLRE